MHRPRGLSHVPRSTYPHKRFGKAKTLAAHACNCPGSMPGQFQGTCRAVHRWHAQLCTTCMLGCRPSIARTRDQLCMLGCALNA
eukprot:361625-Chlamydomonas_euryale.AAC.5